MYNNNKYSCYIRRRITRIFVSVIQDDYNNNKYSCYTRRCITRIFIVIQEDV